jgi:copper resistance protein C
LGTVDQSGIRKDEALRTPDMHRRPLVPSAAARRGAAVFLATLALLLTAPSVAQAHDELVGSSPQAGATLDAAPAQVELQFSGEIQELGTQVVVTADDGTTVSDGPARVDRTTVLQPLAADLPVGAYTVDWRVTSADGHPLSDEFSFTVAGAASRNAAASSETESSSGIWIAVGAAVVLLVAGLVAVRQLRRRA